MRNRQSNQQKLLLIVCAFLCASLVLPAFAEEKGPRKRLTPVVISEARIQYISPTISVPGTVVSKQQSELPAEVEGRLTWVADVGATVKKGEAVARLDSKLFRLKVAENKAALKRDKAKLVFLEKELERQQQLSKSDFSSKTEQEKVRLDYDVALSELAVTNAKVEIDEEILRQYEIRAPFNGVVIARQKREGEWVGSGDSVSTLSNPDQLEVIARVSEISVPFVQVKNKLRVLRSSDARSGDIRAIVRIGDAQSHLYDMRVDVVGKDWMAGQAVRVEVPTGEAREVLTVPRDALVMRSSGTSIFRINNENKAEKISVSTGIASGEYIQVIGDLSAGDRIVIRGGERLRPGQEVAASLDKRS